MASIFYVDSLGRDAVNISVGSKDYYKVDLSERMDATGDTITDAEFSVDGDISIDSQEFDDTTATVWLDAADCEVGDMSKIKLTASTDSGVINITTITAYLVE
jgi:hypothetical protein